jgi:hypothetical protein
MFFKVLGLCQPQYLWNFTTPTPELLLGIRQPNPVKPIYVPSSSPQSSWLYGEHQMIDSAFPNLYFNILVCVGAGAQHP